MYSAGVEPGDYVAVVGCGGIGSNAVQGAAMAGARVVAAIDPVAFKREKAMEFGATHTFSSIEEAMARLRETTWDRGYDKVIMTMGTGDGETLGRGVQPRREASQDRRHQPALHGRRRTSRSPGSC